MPRQNLSSARWRNWRSKALLERSDTYGSSGLLFWLSFGRCVLIPRLQIEFSSLWLNITSGGLTFHEPLGGDRVTRLHKASDGVARVTDLDREAFLELHLAARHLQNSFDPSLGFSCRDN